MGAAVTALMCIFNILFFGLYTTALFPASIVYCTYTLISIVFTLHTLLACNNYLGGVMKIVMKIGIACCFFFFFQTIIIENADTLRLGPDGDHGLIVNRTGRPHRATVAQPRRNMLPQTGGRKEGSRLG
jgi:hypothetical protein